MRGSRASTFRETRRWHTKWPFTTTSSRSTQFGNSGWDWTESTTTTGFCLRWIMCACSPCVMCRRRSSIPRQRFKPKCPACPMRTTSGIPFSFCKIQMPCVFGGTNRIAGKEKKEKKAQQDKSTQSQLKPRKDGERRIGRFKLHEHTLWSLLRALRPIGNHDPDRTTQHQFPSAQHALLTPPRGIPPQTDKQALRRHVRIHVLLHAVHVRVHATHCHHQKRTTR